MILQKKYLIKQALSVYVTLYFTKYCKVYCLFLNESTAFFTLPDSSKIAFESS